MCFSQQWQRMLLSPTFLESISESPKAFPKVFILILGFETHFTFASLIYLNCLTSSAVRMNRQQHSCCSTRFKTITKGWHSFGPGLSHSGKENFSTSSSRNLQEWETGRRKAENHIVPTNQLNNIKSLEKESQTRNSDLLRTCHQNKHQNHNTPHKEPETKPSFIHPLKTVVVRSICSVIHKSLTPLNTVIRQPAPLLKLLSFHTYYTTKYVRLLSSYMLVTMAISWHIVFNFICTY